MMPMGSPQETTIETRTVRGRTFEVVQLTWPDGGVLYDLYLRSGNDDLELITDDESLETIPTDEEICIHMEGQVPSCRFCGAWVGTEGHIVSADPKVLACASCWDERLR